MHPQITLTVRMMAQTRSGMSCICISSTVSLLSRIYFRGPMSSIAQSSDAGKQTVRGDGATPLQHALHKEHRRFTSCMNVVQHLRDIEGRCLVIHIIKEDTTYASMLLPCWYVEVLITPSLEVRVQVWVMLVTCIFPEPVKLLCILLIKICWCQVTTTTIPSLISHLCSKSVPPFGPDQCSCVVIAWHEVSWTCVTSSLRAQ